MSIGEFVKFQELTPFTRVDPVHAAACLVRNSVWSRRCRRPVEEGAVLVFYTMGSFSLLRAGAEQGGYVDPPAHLEVIGVPFQAWRRFPALLEIFPNTPLVSAGFLGQDFALL